MSNIEVVIASAARTPIGSFNGSLKDLSSVDLGSTVIKEVIKRANIEEDEVDQVIMGNVLQSGLGQNPARQASIQAGLANHVPAFTVNDVCGSGLKAIHLAFQAILTGESDLVIAGGMENMSQAPYLVSRNMQGIGNKSLKDSMISDGLWCGITDMHMGNTAENLCEKFNFTRHELDEFALSSQEKAEAAQREGLLKDEIIPIKIKHKKDTFLFDRDEHPRSGITLEKLSKLRPAFKESGLVTAGNASGINDGAAAVVVMSSKKAKQLGIEPLAIIEANASAGVDPSVMGLGPVPATEKALDKMGLTIDEIDLLEVNEAFASQALAFIKSFQLNREKMNVNGGAIAFGHPIGASGARIMVTLLYEIKRRKAQLGLASLCIGGGQGIATIVRNSNF
ncbi:acetyl-CoA C-acetyltransferase [Aquibacillus albus]|uniref:acetyl-CoA C-acetyltransferase n=1 Tax=Aquibacillus albus TaxID=1168171 RepID=A0ABS2N4J9_9BACI|nr:acetyl-CoA C-acetyltransferase [Aquibacillus albus]MBM7573047.1 acetyl-CoA C-acetyltransferase [Aquibacillus albus]